MYKGESNTMAKRRPMVAIVGRPNVGKSTFFNRVAGKRIAIVQDEPGVTRDRIYADAEWCGVPFTMIDTGGIDTKANDIISVNIVKQAQMAVDMADVILFFVDGKQGLTPADYDVAGILRKTKKPVLLVVNKLDTFDVSLTYDFYALGLGEPLPISSVQARGIGDLLDAVVAHFPKQLEETEVDKILKIAIVGKPNAGKSSMINRLVRQERVIVSHIAGTTRDAVEIPFTYNKQKYMLIDTAGMRRKRSIEGETVEQYSVYRTIDAIERADVVVMVMDASTPITEQDVRLCGLIHERNKPSVIVMNKWDLIEKDTSTMQKFTEKLDIDLAFMKYYKPVFLSALTGKRMEKLMEAVLSVYENANRRITTGVLNDIIQNALATSVSSKKGKKLKIYYATQTGIVPPTFVLFVNDVLLVTDAYSRYIENCIRHAVDFSGTPIRIHAKNRKEEE